MKTRYYMKGIAGITVFAFLVTQVVATPEGVSYVESRVPTEVRITPEFNLSIPAELGSVDVLKRGTGPTLIQIQEAHGNLEGEKKIEQILHFLRDNHNVKLIFLEGTAFKLQPEFLRLFPEDAEKTVRALAGLTSKGLVTGPELFLAADEGSEGYGIEDLDAYVRNGRVFKEVLEARAETSQFLAALELKIKRISSAYLNKELREFLKQEEDYDQKLTPFQNWVTNIRKMAQEKLELDLAHPLNQVDWPMLVRVFTLEQLEEELNLTEFATERAAFLNAIKVIPSRVYKEVATLLNSPVGGAVLSAPETGLLFERMISELPEDFDHDFYPSVKLFIGHLILQSELSGALLMEEVSRATGLITEALVASDAERELVSALEDYRLLKRLFALELTPKDFERFTVMSFPRKRESTSLGTLKGGSPIKTFGEDGREKITLRPLILTKRFESLNQQGLGRNLNFEHLDEINALYEKALDFYRGARERDTWMLRNIEARLKETGSDKAVVITGGFHARPFQEFFESRGYNYALITPNLSTVDGRDQYIESFLKFFKDPADSSTRRNAPFIAADAHVRALGGDPVAIRAEVRKTLVQHGFTDTEIRTSSYFIQAASMRSEVRTKKDSPTIAFEGWLESVNDAEPGQFSKIQQELRIPSTRIGPNRAEVRQEFDVSRYYTVEFYYVDPSRKGQQFKGNTTVFGSDLLGGTEAIKRHLMFTINRNVTSIISMTPGGKISQDSRPEVRASAKVRNVLMDFSVDGKTGRASATVSLSPPDPDAHIYLSQVMVELSKLVGNKPHEFTGIYLRGRGRPGDEYVETPSAYESEYVHDGDLIFATPIANHQIITGLAGSVYALAYSPDGSQIATGVDAGNVDTWDSQTGAPQKTFEGHNAYVSTLAYSLDGRRIVSGDFDGMIKAWDTESGELQGTLDMKMDYVGSLAYSPAGTGIAIGGKNGALQIWNPFLTRKSQDLEGHTSNVYAVAFSTGGNRLVSGSSSGSIRIWDLKDKGYESFEITGAHEGSVRAVVFSPDGRHIVSGGDDGTVRILDAYTGELKKMARHGPQVDAVAYSPDGSQIALAGQGTTVRILDVETGNFQKTHRAHLYRVRALAFSPDGTRLASGSAHDIRIWDTNPRAEVHNLEEDPSSINRSAALPSRELQAPDARAEVRVGRRDLLKVGAAAPVALPFLRAASMVAQDQQPQQLAEDTKETLNASFKRARDAGDISPVLGLHVSEAMKEFIQWRFLRSRGYAFTSRGARALTEIAKKYGGTEKSYEELQNELNDRQLERAFGNGLIVKIERDEEDVEYVRHLKLLKDDYTQKSADGSARGWSLVTNFFRSYFRIHGYSVSNRGNGAWLNDLAKRHFRDEEHDTTPDLYYYSLRQYFVDLTLMFDADEMKRLAEEGLLDRIQPNQFDDGLAKAIRELDRAEFYLRGALSVPIRRLVDLGAMEHGRYRAQVVRELVAVSGKKNLNNIPKLFQASNGALEALGKIKRVGDAALSSIIEVVEDQNRNSITRSRAIDALGNIGNPRAIAPLLEIDRKESVFSDERVARALGKMPAEASTKALVKILERDARIIAERGDEWFRPGITGEALEILVQRGGKTELDFLIAQLSSSASENHRAAAALELAKSDSERVFQPLAEVLKKKAKPHAS